MVGLGGSSPLSPGTRIGPYRVEAYLGRGSSGHVYRARDERLDRIVAVKVLPGWLLDDDRARARFRAEARLAASLDHPNVLPVYDAGEDEGVPWIAMRLAAGSDLREILRRDGALEPSRVAAILGGVAAALDAAHAIGLLHRDVKPGNIVLAGDGHAYLADFGLATLAHDRSLTRTGELLGTIDYVSPEQARGDPLDARSDVYSLAAVAYESLTGRPPFGHLAALAALGARLQEPPPPPTSIRPDLPPRVDVALLRALAPDPGARPGSARAFVAELQAALEGPQLRGFLFADLRDYTAFTARQGDERAAALLGRYRTLVRNALARTGGAEIRTEGDSFYAVFASATSAIRAGLAITTAAEAATADDPTLPVRVGVGIHAGEPTAAPEGPIGGAVNLAARLCSLATPGEVLVSGIARGLAAGSVDLAFAPRGRRMVKGLAEPVETWAVVPVTAADRGATAGSGTSDRRTAVGSRGRTGSRVAVVATAAIGITVLLAIGILSTRGTASPPAPTGSAAGAQTGSSGPPGTPVSSSSAPAAAQPSPSAGGLPLGATPTPGPWPNAAERDLLAALPADLEASCERGATMDDARLAGFVGKVPTAFAGSPPKPVGYVDILPPSPLAGVTCRLADGLRLYVQRQPLTGRSVDTVSLADEYVGFVAGRWGAGQGSCSAGAPALTRWASSAGSSGRLACFRSLPYDGRPWLYFSFDGGRYLAFATRNDADYEALHAWWEQVRPFLP